MELAQPGRFRCTTTGCNPVLFGSKAAWDHVKETGHAFAKWPVRSAEGLEKRRRAYAARRAAKLAAQEGPTPVAVGMARRRRASAAAAAREAAEGLLAMAAALEAEGSVLEVRERGRQVMLAVLHVEGLASEALVLEGD